MDKIVTYDGKDKLAIILGCLTNGSLKVYAEGIRTFRDARKTLYVDINKGEIGVLTENGLKMYIKGTNSVKKNGYVYAEVSYYHDDGTIQSDEIAHHRIIGLIADRAGYESTKAKCENPIACHINGIPWDNRASNIEWGTTGENNRQSKVARSIHEYFADKGYTSLICKAGSDFIKIEQGLYNSWINDYISLIGYNPFKLKRNDRYIEDVKALQSFIDYLFERGYWK